MLSALDRGQQANNILIFSSIGTDKIQFGSRREKTFNNKGAVQPAHPHRLISAFVARFFESIISLFASCEISIFELVPKAKETGLSDTFSETPKPGLFYK